MTLSQKFSHYKKIASFFNRMFLGIFSGTGYLGSWQGVSFIFSAPARPKEEKFSIYFTSAPARSFLVWQFYVLVCSLELCLTCAGTDRGINFYIYSIAEYGKIW
jgi:hypothetical protein